MTKKEVVIKRLDIFLSEFNGKIIELESNDEFIIIEAEEEYEKDKEGMRDAWNDFKEGLRLLKENGMWIEYEDNECPAWGIKEWQISINIKKSYIRGLG